jgi:hypothetical protein
MSEWVRVVTFNATSDGIDALVQMISESDGPPPGVDASRIIVLGDRTAGRLTVAIRFPSQEAMQAGAAVLEGMDPPAGLTRDSVEELEVLLERTR